MQFERRRSDEHAVEAAEMENSDVGKFFAGQTIFVTGGTGFLGKLLIDKLLRDCNDLRKIYVLVRTKKGKSESERFQEIFDSQCFKPLKEKFPNFLEKVSLINGDCTEPDVGLTPESKRIITTEVTTIFHVAATVRFDQHLRSATYINVRSIRDLLRMAKTMPQLKAFIHVSTAYSHCTRNQILEQFYPPPIAAENLLNVLNSLDDETITKITPVLLKDWPNGYVFTKAIAESVVQDEGKDLPVAIVRPAIVTSSLREPVPGWVDNIYGVNGVVAGAALGILRTMPADPNVNAELVPVDCVINTIIAAAWYIANHKLQQDENGVIPIFNYTLSPWQQLTWGKFFELSERLMELYPPTKAIWHFCFALRPNPIMHEMAIFFLHTLPAHIMDFVLLCIGQKTRSVAGYKKARKFLDVIAYFAQRNWDFGSENTKKLLSSLTPRDKETFEMDLRKADLTSFVENAMIGGRVYLLQDPLDTVPEAKKKSFRLKIAHYVLCAFVMFLLLKIFLFIFGYVFDL